MPQAVGVAVVEGLLASGVYSGVVLTVAYYVAYAATVYALNKAAESLSRKPGKNGPGSGLEIAVIDSASDGRIIYGTIRTSGVNVIPPLTSNNSSNPKAADGAILHQVLALAVHECASFGSWYLDDDVITQGELTSVSGTANDGKVGGTGKYKNAAWLRGYLGTTTQNVDYILNTAFPTNFTSSFRGRNICYAAAAFDWGKGKTYTGGQPNISVLVSGKKCYDPRLDASPGADPTNAAYAAHTSNPALIWADYKTNATYGQGVAAIDIDWTCVVNAANDCDVLVNIPGATTQKRYTFNGVMSCNADVSDNEKDIVDAMMGKLSFSGGLWRIFAGAWRAPEFSITREDWVSISVVQAVAPRDDGRYNGVVVYHVDEARKWQRVEAYRRVNDTYKTADAGERIWIEMDQPYTMTGFEAQRKGEFLLRQSRNGITFAGTLPPKFMKLRTWDNVTLTFEDLGWVSKTFTVSSCVPRPDGAVDVVLSEEQDTDWTDLLAAEYDNPSISDIPATNPTSPTEPQNVSAVGLPGEIAFRWDDPVTLPLDTRYQIIMANSPNNAAVGTIVWDGRGNNATVGSLDTTPRYWWMRAYANSYFSLYEPNTVGTLYRAQPMDDGTFSQRAIIDEEFQYDVGSKHWFWYVQSSALIGKVGSAEIVPDISNVARGVFRLHGDPSSQTLIELRAKRSPPQTSLPGQALAVYLRFRRALSVTSGSISVRINNVNSQWTTAPNSITGAIIASRPDGRDVISIKVGSGFGANVESAWFGAIGYVMASNSFGLALPWQGIQILYDGAVSGGGDVDIDKISVWPVNSTANAGSYYIVS